MLRYLDLCVELKKSHLAKEGLYQYKNICQNVNKISAIYYLSVHNIRDYNLHIHRADACLGCYNDEGFGVIG